MPAQYMRNHIQRLLMQLPIFEPAKQKFMSTDKNKHAETIIRNHIIWSLGAGIIPVAVADIFAVSAVQIDMIRQLCKVYEVPFEETQGKAVVTSITSSTLARAGAASAVKLIPGMGSVLGGLTQSVFAGASTYALGEAFKKHFETGGTFLDFDINRLKKIYKEKFEKGKEVAREMAKKSRENFNTTAGGATDGFDIKPDVPVANADTIQQLKELAILRKEGILSEAEFEAVKKRILNTDASVNQ